MTTLQSSLGGPVLEIPTCSYLLAKSAEITASSGASLHQSDRRTEIGPRKRSSVYESLSADVKRKPDKWPERSKDGILETKKLCRISAALRHVLNSDSDFVGFLMLRNGTPET
jgi:hypothetical protein